MCDYAWRKIELTGLLLPSSVSFFLLNEARRKIPVPVSAVFIVELLNYISSSSFFWEVRRPFTSELYLLRRMLLGSFV